MWQLPPFWRASIAVDIAAIAGAVGMPIMGADIVTGGAITNAAGVEVVAGVVVPVGGPVVTMDAAGSSCIKGYVVYIADLKISSQSQGAAQDYWAALYLLYSAGILKPDPSHPLHQFYEKTWLTY